MGDHAWIAEAVVQFSRSPMWRTPVNNFVDENCYYFDDESEMKFEYTEVHNKFRELVDGLLTDFVTELGVNMNDAMAAIKHTMSHSKHSARDATSRMVKYILSVDDFVIFHRMMVKRNIELDILSSASIAAKNSNAQLAVGTNGNLDEEEALRMALAISLQDQDMSEKQVALEDAELQEVLAFSIEEENERARQLKQQIESEAQQLATTDANAAQQLRAEKIASVETQKEQNIHNLSERTLVAREENIVRNISTQFKHAPSLSRGMPTTVQPVQDIPLNAAHISSAVPAPVVTHQPPVVAAPAPSAPAHPASSVQQVPVPAAAPAPQLPAPTMRLGLAPLPPISQPPLSALREKVASSTQATPPPATTTAAPAPRAAAPTQAAKPTKEELEQRAKYMRDQREKILSQNKAARQKELSEYAQQNGMATPGPGSDGVADPATKQLTVDIAHRLRGDILGEARK